ncbi:MAG: hypothetical protein J5880_03680 [Bacilli bacterium]|nr:hypothetical protein [Bacilli bacterium]
MRLAKIKNKYMYKTTPDDEGTHYYLVFYDCSEKRYKAIQLTHLYIKDKNRFIQVSKGFITIEKFKEFDVPSGVRQYVYETNVDGNKIDLLSEHVTYISKRYLSKKQSDRIKKFAKKKKTLHIRAVR